MARNDLSSIKKEIFNRLNFRSVFPELNPKESSGGWELNCPACHGTHKDKNEREGFVGRDFITIKCHRETNCGAVTNLIDHYMDTRKISNFWDALKELASKANVSLPEASEEDKRYYARKQQTQNIYNEIATIANKALISNTNVYKYLTEERKYDSDDIRKMNLGITPNGYQLKQDLISKGYDTELVEQIVSNFSATDGHPLYIPLKNSNNEYESFLCRCVTPHIQPKYKAQKLDENEKGFRTNSFQGIGHIKYSRSKEIIIVEGEMDALRLQSLGFPAVAIGKNAPSEEQINDALKSGIVRKIVLCLDPDKAGIKGIRKAIELLSSHDVELYVMQLEYKDPDEMFKAIGKAEGIEIFKNSHKNARHYALWYIESIARLEAISTDSGRETVKKTVFDFMETEYDRMDGEIRYKAFELISSKLGVPVEAIQDYADQKHREKEEQNNRVELIKNAEKALKDYTENHDISKLKTVLDTHISKAVSTYATVQDVFSPYSFGMLKEEILTMREGMNYGYLYLQGKALIPIGATTLIAGRTSHGKTTFMLNVFINMILNYPDKKFYFFACEEARKRLTVKLISILTNRVLVKGESNYKTILKYIKTDGKEQGVFDSVESLEAFNKAIQDYDEFVKSGRLNINYTNLDVDTIAGMIRNFGDDTGAVFIDHAHAIKFNGNVENETLRLKYISNILLDTAVTTDLPLIIGVQLNRMNPKERPSLENIKQAGAFEEDANVVMGVYNFKTGSYINKEGVLTNDQKHTIVKGTTPRKPEYSHPENIDFEVHLLKAREGDVNAFDCLKFNSRTLVIRDSE